jgi:hypothetical protein
MQPERRPVAVRAWTTTDDPPTKPQGIYVDLGTSPWALVLDTETTVDLAQSLRFGTYQLRHHDRLREAGIFYDPDGITADELAVIRTNTAERGLAFHTVDQFIRRVFLPYAWRRRALVVGFNLPFDLSRLAIDHAPARPRGKDQSMRGGFSFAYTPDRRDPRVQIKKIGPRAAFIRFATPSGRQAAARNRARGGTVANHRGYFVDVTTLAAALLGKKFTLARLADLLETQHRKLDWDDHDTTVTASYLDYAMTDVQVHWECFTALRGRYDAMGLPTPIYRIYSEASVAKGYLDAMGIRPWLDVQPDVPDWLIATLMETYAGGRCECHVRRTAVPGLLVDFRSEYPTSFVLQGLHWFLVAEGFDHHERDPVEVTAWIESLTIDALLEPRTWKDLAVVVEIVPDDDYLPTRAQFQGTAWNLGIQRRFGGPRQWFTLADAVASWLATGRTPKIVRALAFTPRALQTGLAPIDLGGDRAFHVDPTNDDVVQRFVELRTTIRQMAEQNANATGAMAEQLSATAAGLKITMNSIYGMAVERNITNRSKPAPVALHPPDGTTHCLFQTNVEESGRYFHPLLATFISAGGRLLLALAVRLVADIGGTYVMCDTDSLFIAATTDGSPGSRAPNVPTASIHDVLEGVIRPFERLNPYDRTVVEGSILELKGVSIDPTTQRPQLVFCFAVASKRYALYTLDENGIVRICVAGNEKHRSEHGLGHLLRPFDLDGGTDWIGGAWEYLIAKDISHDFDEPSWFDQPCFGRIAITNPRDDSLFHSINETLQYRRRIRPFGFALVAYRHHTERCLNPDDGLLVAPYTRDLRQALSRAWIARNTEPGAVHIWAGRPEFAAPRTVCVQTYRDLIAEYLQHPERKAVSETGQPCRSSTRGVLAARHIEASTLVRIGKESNRLGDGDPIDGRRDRVREYTRHLTCRGCGARLHKRQRVWCSDGCRKRTTRRV